VKQTKKQQLLSLSIVSSLKQDLILESLKALTKSLITLKIDFQPCFILTNDAPKLSKLIDQVFNKSTYSLLISREEFIFKIKAYFHDKKIFPYLERPKHRETKSE